MQLHRVVAQPVTPSDVVGASRRDDGPEARAVAEHPQVRELVDHDRLEGLRRGEDQPPREGQPAGAGRAPPPRPRVAQRHRRRLDADRGRVLRDLRLDVGPRPRPEPGLEHGAHRTTVARRDPHDQGRLVDADHAGHRRAAGARSRDEVQPVEVAAVAEARAVLEPAPGGEDRPVRGLAREMAAQPRLARGEERHDVALGVAPARPPARGHRHDHAAVRVDDDAQRARPRGAAERVVERAAGEVGDGRGLGRGDHAPRRRSRPVRTPVSWPSSTASPPLTITWSMPPG